MLFLTETLLADYPRSSSTSSASAFVNETGAGSDSTAIATSASGETSISSDSAFTPGATSSSSSASAIAGASVVETTANADAPAESSAAPVQPIDNGAVSTVQPTAQSTGITASLTALMATNQLIVGKSSDDRLLGHANNDRIEGRAGNDRLIGRSGQDYLIGARGDDLLEGGNGNDRLEGRTGDDRLIGGFGRDRMIGGSGADCFILREQSTLQLADVIVDFKARQRDTFKLQGNISIKKIRLRVFDSDGNGVADATLISLKHRSSVLAIALGTIDSAGKTTLSNENFV